jgi:hypothetical protein
MSQAHPATGVGAAARPAPALASAVVAVVAACLLAVLGAPAAHADATTGYVIVGPVSDAWGTNNGVTVGAAAIANNTSQTSSPLFLEIWATPIADGTPALNKTFNFYDLGGANLGTLGPGQQFTNVLQTGLTYTPIPKGCYFVMLALLNGTTLVDLFPFGYTTNAANIPAANGYLEFSFSGATCPAATSCANSGNVACLVDGRFQITETYYNAIDGKQQAQVMSFGPTRAQSDESIFYYFTNPSNFEMGINVLDACAITNSFWVFLGGLTNQGWEVNVLDTQTGNHKSYRNNLNTVTVTTTDTVGLPCP